MTSHLDPAVRHDFELLFDVEGGNPNGDPDNANAPRTDPLTGHLWVTDVAIKRKVRNFIAAAYGGEPGYRIYVGEGVALNAHHVAASESVGLKKDPKRNRTDQQSAASVMCSEFFDVRAFGAVMSTGDHPAGQIRGPIQLACPATSIDPEIGVDLTITRVAVTRESDLAAGKDREMGSKHTVPYALFRARGSFTPTFAERSGFSEQDLARFWDALERMWALDRSASRGTTGCRGVHIWSHDDKFGRAHAGALYDRLTIARNDPEKAARRFADYSLSLDLDNLPAGISHTVVAAG